MQQQPFHLPGAQAVTRNIPEAAASHRRPAARPAVTTVTHPGEYPDHAVAWVADFQGSHAVRLRILPDLAAPDAGLPKRDEVRLWLGRPSAPLGAEGWTANRPWLSDEEAERAQRFRFVEDRWSYTAAHAALRLLLGGLIGDAPDKVALVSAAMGKPALCTARHGAATSRAVQFNISHTRGMVAVALSGSPVGVDVEPVRPLPDMRRLVIDLMAPEALTAYDEANDEQARMQLFYRYWTLGEAFIKATGQGLDQGLDSFAFNSEGAPCLTRVTPGWGDAGRWHMGCAGGRKSSPGFRRPAWAAES